MKYKDYNKTTLSVKDKKMETKITAPVFTFMYIEIHLYYNVKSIKYSKQVIWISHFTPETSSISLLNLEMDGTYELIYLQHTFDFME